MASHGPFTDNFYDCFLQLQHASSSRIMGVTWSGGDAALSGDPVDVAERCLAAFLAAWLTGLDTNLLVGPAKVRLGVGGGAPPVVGESTSAPVAGGTSMSSLPSNNGVLIRKVTATGGRHGRGRLTIPHSVGASAWSETGILGSSQLSDHQDRADEFLDQCTTLEVNMGLRHNTGPTTDALIAVTNLAVQSLVGVQRRRIGR